LLCSQNCHKIDHFIAAKTPPGKLDVLIDLVQHTVPAKVRSQQHDFSKPRWRGWNRLRRSLDAHRSIGDTSHMGLLERKCFVFPSQRGTFYPSLLQISSSLRIAWEKQPVIWFQHLLPKGKKSEEERQLFPISPQSYELLCEIGDLLKETYGCIPLVHPNTRNPKAAELKPERYLFQWQATSDGLHGAINPTDVQVLIRFILHGLEIIPPLGEPFNISAHLLRHMVVTATWLRHKDPSQVIAFILHHQSVPPTTEYYS
jgi:integrase